LQPYELRTKPPSKSSDHWTEVGQRQVICSMIRSPRWTRYFSQPANASDRSESVSVRSIHSASFFRAILPAYRRLTLLFSTGRRWAAIPIENFPASPLFLAQNARLKIGAAACCPLHTLAADLRILRAGQPAGIDPRRLCGHGIGTHSLRKTAIDDDTRDGTATHEVRGSGTTTKRTTEFHFLHRQEVSEVRARRIPFASPNLPNEPATRVESH
jgi:hypothetical protein